MVNQILLKLSGPQQRRLNDFVEALRNDCFKTSSVSHLVGSWNDDALANILMSKISFVTCEEKCYSFTNENDRVVRRKEANMVNISEEADTRMLHHIASKSSPGNVVLRTDTRMLYHIASKSSPGNVVLCTVIT